MKRAFLTLCLFFVGGCAVFAEDTLPVATATAPATTTTISSTLPPTSTTIGPPLSITGRVLGPDDVPLVGAMVAMGPQSTTTGTEGLFEMELPGPGSLTVTKPGWNDIEVAWDGSPGVANLEMQPRRVRGLRVGAGAAADDDVFGGLLELADATSVNALVFDTKQEGGVVAYDSDVGEAHEIGAVDVMYDPRRRIAQAREHGLYLITRHVVFEDGARARARPDEKLAGPWIDPRSRSAWDYNISLAAETCEMGFDEIQFDYVRFPAGRTARVTGQLDLAESERVAAIEGFLQTAFEALNPLGCAVSADVFAIVVSMSDDQGLGQRPEEVSRHVDALSPMVYPSHYSLGWRGFADPNDHPYEVTVGAIDDALARMEPGTILRPWLQGFWWTSDQIRSSIQAAEDRDLGWILWNVASNYDVGAIPTDEEVSQ